jgi:hypothetical protein
MEEIMTEAEYQSKLDRCRELFDHAKSDCTDPDCEIHNPWMQEDEAEMMLACAYFVAGAQRAHGFLSSQLDEMHERANDELTSILQAPERMEEIW